MTCVTGDVNTGDVDDGVAELVFPRLSPEEPGATGIVATWFAADGAEVATGSLLAIVEGPHALGEITAPLSGVLRHKVRAGTAVPQGTVIGVLEWT
ncbi:MAG: biotin/lipoyl-containing protein [Nocardioidaceae bacterium]